MAFIPEKIIKVLVVDDSAYIRKVIKQMLSRSPFVEVVGTAHDGRDALDKVEQLKPDVITLDLIMPDMDGVEFVKAQMARYPLPIIIVSIANEGGEMALSALDEGAVDFLQKPTALANEKIYEISDELIDKVKTASTIPLNHLRKTTSETFVPVVPSFSSKPKIDLVAIGISTGGPQALAYFIPQLPADFPVPIVVVLHMPVGYTTMYAQRLNNLSALTVLEAEEGMVLQGGKVYIAPAGRHLTFRQGFLGEVVCHLSSQPFDTLHRPSVDVMFESVAETYLDRSLGIIMTGMGSDGKQGSAWIKSKGGKIITEAEATCIVYGMPRSVVEAGLSDREVPLNQMAQTILSIVNSAT